MTPTSTKQPPEVAPLSDLACAQQFHDARVITTERFNHIRENIRARAVFRDEEE